MKRLLVATCLVSMLLCEAAVAPAPQVLVKTRGKQEVSEQDTEKAWGARALDPPEKGGQLLWPLPRPRLKLAAAAEKKLPGANAWAGTQDILRRFRVPKLDPEPDLDDQHHPHPKEALGEEGPRLWVLPPRQVLPGPEEDRDHIHHPA
ncbi:proline-rich acidic protein 1 isoform X1 [Lepus europaeus]|uniref:proline-rich acidic protein 1 isoform X1 n=2 Tax=Lepus europaeus TaxID=9983 RepID=UPI002B460657|nr:proline-rich acidic protein 1 isoform X1 [Lepus europaeus]